MIIHYQKQASNKNSEEIKTAGKWQRKPTVGRAKRITRDRQFQPSSWCKSIKDLPSNAFLWNICLSHRNPKINVSLPIFDQTTEIFCKRNVIIEESSYPTGGKHPCRSFWASWTPEAKLFTDLPKLKKETSFHPDQWKTLAYQVEKSKWSYLMK